MGVIAAAVGVGLVIGPGIGGLLATDSLSTPFYVASALSMVALALVWLFVPESLPEKDRSRPATTSETRVTRMWRQLFGPLGFLLILAMLVSFAFTNFATIFGLFAEHRHGFGPREVGAILMVEGFVSTAIQAGVTGPVTRRFGEARAIKASLIVSAVGFVLMLLAGGFATVLLTVAFFICGDAMIRPSVAALISKRSAGGQGVAMGLTNAFMSLGRIVGPLWAGTMFDLDVSLPYLSGAVILLLIFVMALRWLSNDPSPESVISVRISGD